VPLDRNQLARFLFLCRQHRAPGRLSAAALAVAVALVRLLGHDGRLDPSHAFLARKAACHVATVQRALERLRGLGLLSWQRRLVRAGWRVEQTSNAYWLTPNSAVPTDLQSARQVQLVLFKKAAPEGQHVAPEIREAAQWSLATIRRRRIAALGLA
jgi:hypothetical protein